MLKVRKDLMFLNGVIFGEVLIHVGILSSP
jgi:hypothetical protein